MSLFLTMLRWGARLAALVVAGGFVLLIFGEFIQPHSPSGILASTAIPLLTLTCTGMLLAWRWELPGAVMSLGALVAFMLMVRMGHHGVLFVLAAPGILFLADWMARRRTHAFGGRAR